MATSSDQDETVKGPQSGGILPLFQGAKLTVTGRITLWYLILTLAPMLAIGFLAYQNSRGSLEKEITNKLDAVADNKIYLLKVWFKDQLSDAQNLANNEAVRDVLSPSFRVVYPNLAAKTEEERIQKVKNHITALQETNPSYVDVLIADNGGRIVNSSSKALLQEGQSLSEMGLSKLDRTEAFSVSPVFFSKIAQQHVFTIASPVYDNNANVVGHGILEIELRPIHRLMEERSGLGETGEVIIVDRRHRMLSQSRFSEESTLLKTVRGNYPMELGFQGTKGIAFHSDYRNVPVISSIRPVPELDAVLIAKIDEAEGLAPVARLRNTIFLIIALTMGLAAWVALWVARTTTRPILEAEALDRLKADFTAMIIHDLRSPLTNVMAVVAMMEDGLFGPINDEQKKWLAKIESSTRNLAELVSDFLDLSKLEAGRLDLTKQEMDLRLLLQNCIDNYSLLAQDRRIALKADISPNLSRIQADPLRLDQVLNNLLSNAIKFSREGGEVELGAAEGDGAVKVWVKDTGVGIASREIGQIFQKYRQTASAKSSKDKGTGLGLVICKMIVEAHGGSIRVESEEGRGTTFTFSLPV